MKKQWLIAAVAVMMTLGTLAFVRAQSGEGDTAAATAEGATDPRQQPIAFPHATHAGTAEGQFGMDCQYCHYSAERSVDAGIPPVETCMGCHLVINGRNAPQEVQKIRDYFSAGQAIPWVRIYKVSDHVHFPHMRHVAAGVECQTCHGQVQEFTEPVQRVNQPLAMGWCVSCHVERGVRRDCTVCHY